MHNSKMTNDIHFRSDLISDFCLVVFRMGTEVGIMGGVNGDVFQHTRFFRPSQLKVERNVSLQL